MFVEVKLRTVFFLQTLYFRAFIATVGKIITYALGEHDPGSAQDWRTSNDFCSPADDHLGVKQESDQVSLILRQNLNKTTSQILRPK